MAIGDIAPPFPRRPSVQDMLLQQAGPRGTPDRALQAAFNSGAIDASELNERMITRPNSQVRAFAGGQMTPDEFMQSQRMATNPNLPRAAMGATDDLLTQALARNAPMQGPALPSAAANAARVAPSLMSQASALGGLPGGGPAFAPTPAPAPGAGGFMARLRGMTKPKFGAGALMRAGMFAGGGLMGRGLVDSMDIGGEGSGLDNALAGGTAGAGIGAAVGSVVPGLGSAVGAGVGFVGGALLESMIGDKTNKADRIESMYDGSRSVITDLGQTYGLSQSTLDNLLMEFDISASLMRENGDEDGLKALVTQLQTSLPSTLMEYRMQDEMERKQNERMLSIQTQFAPIFEGIIGRSAANSGIAYEQALVAADTLGQSNPQLAALVRSNAANTQSSSDAMMAAYASQAALGMSGGLEEQMMLAANTQPVRLGM